MTRSHWLVAAAAAVFAVAIAVQWQDIERYRRILRM